MSNVGMWNPDTNAFRKAEDPEPAKGTEVRSSVTGEFLGHLMQGETVLYRTPLKPEAAKVFQPRRGAQPGRWVSEGENIDSTDLQKEIRELDIKIESQHEKIVAQHAKAMTRSPRTRQEWYDFIAPHVPCHQTVEGLCANLANIKPLDVERLGRALFDTDEEVIAYVRTRADDNVIRREPVLQREGRPKMQVVMASTDEDFGRNKFIEAMDACWKVDDRGYKTRSLKRAKEMLGALT